MSVLKHERFERAPVALHKRRRGPAAPRNVVAITTVKRLPIGSAAVIVAAPSKDTEPSQNIGKRVVITAHTRGAFSVCVDSLDGPLALDGGGTCVRDIRYRPANLRRLWIGLTASERMKLALLRKEVAHG